VLVDWLITIDEMGWRGGESSVQSMDTQDQNPDTIDMTAQKFYAVGFGHAVHARRYHLGYSQEELAERAGLHRSYIGVEERGEKNVKLYVATQIAKALGISICELVER